MKQLQRLRLWNGLPLPPGLRTRLERQYASLQFVEKQIRAVEAIRRQMIRTLPDPIVEQVRHLMKLRRIGENSAWLFVMEFFGWRNFRNRREVEGLAGLTPTHHQIGARSHEQGISKAGNRPI